MNFSSFEVIRAVIDLHRVMIHFRIALRANHLWSIHCVHGPCDRDVSGGIRASFQAKPPWRSRGRSKATFSLSLLYSRVISTTLTPDVFFSSSSNSCFVQAVRTRRRCLWVSVSNRSYEVGTEGAIRW